MAILGIFLALIGVLEALAFVSRTRHGIAAASQDLRYVWTFGPTLVVTALSIWWYRIEYRSKQLMPWINLHRGKTDARQTLQLNYFSPTMLRSLVSSLWARDSLVSFAIGGSLLLQILTVASTALLSLQSVEVESRLALAATDVFELARPRAPVIDTGRSIIKTIWSIGQYNLSYPAGTTSRYAAQSFRSLGPPGISGRLTATVDVFEADLRCEPYKVDGIVGSGVGVEFNVSSSTRRADRIQIMARLGRADYHADPTVASFAVKPLFGGVTDGSADFVVISVGRLRRGTDRDANSTAGAHVTDAGTDWTIQDLQGLICIPEYSVASRVVTNDTASGALRVSEDGAQNRRPLPPGPSSVNITRGFMQQFTVDFVLTTSGIYNQYASNCSLWFSLLNQTTPQERLGSFSNLTLLEQASRDVYRKLAAQFIKREYTEATAPAQEAAAPLQGTAVTLESRVLVQEFPLRLAEGLLGALALITGGIIWVYRPALPVDPGSLVAHAIVLARSQDLASTLAGAGGFSQRQLNRVLAGRSFKSSRPSDEGYFSIVEIHGQQGGTGGGTTSRELERLSSRSGGSAGERRAAERKTKKKPEKEKIKGRSENEKEGPWTPLASSVWFLVCLLVSLVAIITAAELMFQQSTRRQGLADVTTEGYVKYVWSVVPAATMATISLLFNMLDDAARTLLPFQLLHRGEATFAALNFDPFGRSTAAAIPRALRKRHWAVVPFMAATLLAPTLTVVTSGLFAPYTVPYTNEASVELRGWFDYASAPRPEVAATRDLANFQVAALTELIVFDNVSYPQWTYETLALPGIQLSNPATQGPEAMDANSSESRLLSVRMPALRGRFNCSLERAYNNLTVAKASPGGGGMLRLDLTDTFPEPALCPSPNRTAWFQLDVSVPPEKGYFAGELTISDPTFKRLRMPHVEACGDGRLHAWFAAGRFDGERVAYMSMIHCMPYVEALATDVTFRLPEYSIVASQDVRPRALEDTARALPGGSGENGPTGWALSQDLFIDDHLSIARPGEWNIANVLFKTLALSPGGAPLAELVAPATLPRLLGMMDRLYGRQVAQLLNVVFRRPIGTSKANGAGTAAGVVVGDDSPDGVLVGLLGSGLRGNVTAPQRLRLRQSEVSTRLLEGVLGAMALCAFVGGVLSLRAASGARGPLVLYSDPNSLGAKMALFAGGRLIGMLPEGLEFRGEREINRMRLFQGMTFGLGWWGSSAQRRYGIDVGRVGSDARAEVGV